MKIKLILIISIVLICCSGCGSAQYNEYDKKREISDNFYIHTDKDTCLEYFVSHGPYNIGTVNPRYDVDGNIKQNKKCLMDKENDYE